MAILLHIVACSREVQSAVNDPSKEESFSHWGYLINSNCDANAVQLLGSSFEEGWYNLAKAFGAVQRIPQWARTRCASMLQMNISELQKSLKAMPEQYFEEFGGSSSDARLLLVEAVEVERAKILAVQGQYETAASILETSQLISRNKQDGWPDRNEALIAFLRDDQDKLQRMLPKLRKAAIEESKYCSVGGDRCHGNDQFRNFAYYDALILQSCRGISYALLYGHPCADVNGGRIHIIEPDAEP